MKLLVLNPNTSESVTERIAAAARAAASPGTEIVPMTAQWGVPYIVTRAEAAIATCAALEVMAEHVDGHDAIVLAAFGDPGLDAARELMPVPVIGLSEGSMLTACMLARRFSLVSISPDFTPWYAIPWNGWACNRAWHPCARWRKASTASRMCRRRRRQCCCRCAGVRRRTMARTL